MELTCKNCKNKFHDSDLGSMKEDISYAIDGFCIVDKIHTCIDCAIEECFINKIN